MKRALLFLTPLIVAAPGLSGSAAPASPLGPPVEVAPPPRRVKFPPRFNGVVTAVDRKSITIQGFSFDISGATAVAKRWDKRTIVYTMNGNPLIVRATIGLLYPAGGQPPVEKLQAVKAEFNQRFLLVPDSYTLTAADGAVTVLNRVDQPPRTFEVTDEHRAGGFSPNEAPDGGYTYRLADVRVGDRVSVRFLRTDLFNLVDGISILRRPGGKIPPDPGESPSRRGRHHEKMQAWQDWEDKGILLPDKYHPGGPWPAIAPPPRKAPTR